MVENDEKEKARADNVKATLESKLIQSIVGGNAVKSNPFDYGRFGIDGANQTYNGALTGEDADKMRAELYEKKQKEKEQLGIAEEAPYPTNYDIVAKIIRQVQEVQGMATLGELEAQALAAGAVPGFEVPEELKGYSQNALFAKYAEDGRIDIGKFNDSEKDAIQMKEVLTGLYERALGFKSMQANYYSDLGSMGKEIADKYKKEEPEAA